MGGWVGGCGGHTACTTWHRGWGQNSCLHRERNGESAYCRAGQGRTGQGRAGQGLEKKQSWTYLAGERAGIAGGFPALHFPPPAATPRACKPAVGAGGGNGGALAAAAGQGSVAAGAASPWAGERAPGEQPGGRAPCLVRPAGQHVAVGDALGQQRDGGEPLPAQPAGWRRMWAAGCGQLSPWSQAGRPAGRRASGARPAPPRLPRPPASGRALTWPQRGAAG